MKQVTHLVLMKRILFFLCLSIVCLPSLRAQSNKTENIILITLDGFRWQELFEGADSSLLHSKKYNVSGYNSRSFWHSDPNIRRTSLMPFFWNVIATHGQLYGNRNYGNQINCANPYWFSYPGYSEMLTGRVDRKMSSNRKILNPNTNILEFINEQPHYHGKVAVFSTWDVIPYIIRASSNGIHVNQNRDIVAFDSLNLDSMPGNLVSFKYSGTTRCDESIFHLAFDYLKTYRPKVLFMSLDGTDSKSHAGKYDEYLHYANMSDAMISQLWNWIQSQEDYKDKTTLLITTDHGRGKGHNGAWKTHGRWATGSNQIWFAVMGPDTPPLGEMKNSDRYYQKQIAKTISSLLELNYVSGEFTERGIKSVVQLSNTIVVSR
jgi:hypothetical protein